MAGNKPNLPTFAVHPKIFHAPSLRDVLHLQLAQFFSTECVKQQHRENRAIALALERVLIGCIKEGARLVIAERRGLAFVGFDFRSLHALDRIVSHGVRLTEVFEQ